MSAPPPPPPPHRRRGSNVRIVVLTIALIATIVIGSIVVFTVLVRDSVFDDGPPSCDAEPVSLGWSAPDFGWRRSGPFTLRRAQTVQVDVRLFDTDGGVIQTGSTVYAVPAGEPFPDFGDTATTTDPFRGVRAGHGREAVNEQVRLEAGTWELVVRGGAASADVRWPC